MGAADRSGAPAADRPLLRLRGLTKDYALGETRVAGLRGVDLDVARGELVALAGPSGSGKTTLLSLAGCLDAPTAGRIELDGAPIDRFTHHALAPHRRRLAFVFQHFNLIAVLDARENVELALTFTAPQLGRTDRRRRADEAIAAVGLAGHARHRPDQLSGGQRQRVAIARALATEPLMLLADEPTANLDSETAASILELVAELNRGRGLTVVIATHDPKVIAMSARTVLLRDGRVVGDGRTAPGPGEAVA